MKSVGVYIHIPFCVKKCNYCDFFSVKGDYETNIKYMHTLKDAIIFWKDKLQHRPVDTVYIGGGTPSVLGTTLLSELIINVISAFNVTDEAEVTIEVNPNSVQTLDLKLLKTLGVNRISMGLQSTNDLELKLLGRSHNFYDSLRAVEYIQNSGIDNFSLDVMQGIPVQTIESLDRTLDFCISSGASHISTYMLKIEKNTPFYKNVDNLTFVDEDTVADMYEFTCKKLLQNGFRHYEISNFCRDNKISRHNMKYWLLDDYVGIGPSAHSLLNNKRFYYPSDMKSFESNVIKFESEGNTIEEFVMLSLRTDIGLGISQMQDIFNINISDEFTEEIELLQKNKLLYRNNDKIILTETGFLLSNTIISSLIEKL